MVLASRNVVFEDASGKARTTASSISTPNYLPQESIQSLDGWNQLADVTAQTTRLLPVASALSGEEDESISCTELRLPSSTNISANGSSENWSATPNWDESVLPVESTSVQLVQGTNGLLEPQLPTREGTDVAPISLWLTRTQSS